MKRLLSLVLVVLLFAVMAPAQQPSPASPAKPLPQLATTSPEFLQAADEVMAEMAKLLALPAKTPLKKSIRSRAEIRAFLVKEMEEDKEPQKRYADTKTLEKFGLIPQGFPLDSFMLDLLTEQVAGLYDPKAKEFYIADWIPLEEQRVVMAHELTHALDDQYFSIDAWEKAARPNDDAELARDAVIEGSALAAMLDYAFREQKVSVRDLPDVTVLIRSQALSEMTKDPQLAKAPPFIHDELLFPYLGGTVFTQQFLKANAGWGDFKKVFANPPASTQQILHPELYLGGVRPEPVTLPNFSGLVPPEWKKLDENVIGEFGFHSVLKQFLGQDRAEKLSPAWAGDRYAIFENQKSKQTMLVYRLVLRDADDAARFFTAYGELLNLKYKTRTDNAHRPGFLSFQTPEGGVFLRCQGRQCLTVEGASREVFEKINQVIDWPAASADPFPQKTAALVPAF